MALSLPPFTRLSTFTHAQVQDSHGDDIPVSRRYVFMVCIGTFVVIFPSRSLLIHLTQAH
jgi:hypothetical protein